MALFKSRFPLKASIEAHSHTFMSTPAHRSQPVGGVLPDTVFARGIGEIADGGFLGEGGKRVVYAVPSAPSSCSK